jgi:hypothetical protein
MKLDKLWIQRELEEPQCAGVSVSQACQCRGRGQTLDTERCSEDIVVVVSVTVAGQHGMLYDDDNDNNCDKPVWPTRAVGV